MKSIEKAQLPEVTKQAIVKEFQAASTEAAAKNEPVRMASLPQLTKEIERADSPLAKQINIDTQRTAPVELAKVQAQQAIETSSPAIVMKTTEEAQLPETTKQAIVNEFQAATTEAAAKNEPVRMASLPKLTAEIEKTDSPLAKQINIDTQRPAQPELARVQAQQAIETSSPAIVMK